MLGVNRFAAFLVSVRRLSGPAHIFAGLIAGVDDAGFFKMLPSIEE